MKKIIWREIAYRLIFAGYLFGSLLCSKDGDSIFPQNVNRWWYSIGLHVFTSENVALCTVASVKTESNMRKLSDISIKLLIYNHQHNK
jgi:hypothetical protein